MDVNDINGHLRLTWGLLQHQTLNNLFNISFDSKQIDCKYSLYTPKFLQQETLVLHLKYDDRQRVYTLIDANLHYPGKNCIGSASIHYHSMINVNGTVNLTTSLPSFGHIGCKFVVLTTL